MGIRLGLAGAVVTFVAVVLSWVLLADRRYDLDAVGFNGDQPELRRLVRDQGRLTQLSAFGAALTVLGLILELG